MFAKFLIQHRREMCVEISDNKVYNKNKIKIDFAISSMKCDILTKKNIFRGIVDELATLFEKYFYLSKNSLTKQSAKFE